MIWSSEIERKIAGTFELIFGSDDPAVREACVRELKRLGLADNQIEAGLKAGYQKQEVDL